jgi:phospholipase C
MHGRNYSPGKTRLGLMTGVAALALGAFAASAGATDPDKSAERTPTTTPIKHVIVVLAENSSFDHTFGTFRPRDGQHVANLLSKGIVNADGTPGANFSNAAQFTVTPQQHYFISAPDVSKTPYTTLPPPDLNGVPLQASDSHPPPFATVAAAQAAAGLAEEGMGTSMAFFNMNQGDAPVLRKLALEYAIGDNHHQAVMGGTGAIVLQVDGFCAGRCG